MTNEGATALLRDLLLAFTEWCVLAVGKPAPRDLYDLDRLINTFPMIKQSGWFPVPPAHLDDQERQFVLSVIDTWIARHKESAATKATDHGQPTPHNRVSR